MLILFLQNEVPTAHSGSQLSNAPYHGCPPFPALVLLLPCPSCLCLLNKLVAPEAWDPGPLYAHYFVQSL